MSLQVSRVLACATSLALASCSSTEPQPSAAAGAVTAEQSSGRALLHEVQAWLNGASFDEATYRARFTEAFLGKVPFAKFADIVASLRGRDAWQESRVEEEGAKLIAHWHRGDQKLRVTLVPDSHHARRIAGLWLAPDVDDVARARADKPVEALQALGRAAVERAMTDTGHAHPETNRPFLNTREMLILKFGADDALRKDYLAGDEAARRVLLDARVRAAPLPALDAVTRQLAAGPTLIREIEWLGSPLDLCRVLVVLTKDEAASKILALEPGVPAARGRWSYVGYKGGSETGVLTMAWEHEAASGERYVTAAALSNNRAPVPEDEGATLMAAIRDAAPKLDGIIEANAP